jgi:hypothetical protein
MQVIIHAGLPKTGSSALQQHLASHREQLRERGIIYPDLDGHESHWKVTAAFHNNPEEFHHVRRRMRGEDVQAAMDETKRQLHDCLAAAGSSDTVIISHEGFGNRNTNEGLKEFRDVLLRHTEAVSVVAYGRNPIDLYASNVQQRLKALDNNAQPPSKWVSSHGNRAALLLETFGEDRCEFRIYSPATLVARDVIADFADYLLKTAGKHLPLSSEPNRANTSLSGPACAILMALKKGAIQGIDTKGYAKVRGLLGQFGEGRPAPKLKVPAAWQPTLAAQNYRGWNALVGLTRYDEEQKAALRLPPSESADWITRNTFESWILSYGDRDYTSAFVAFCRSKSKELGPVKAFVDRLEDVSRHFDVRAAS